METQSTLTLTLPWLTSRQSSGSFAHILQGSVLGVEVISAKDVLDHDHEEEKVIHQSLNASKEMGILSWRKFLRLEVSNVLKVWLQLRSVSWLERGCRIHFHTKINTYHFIKIDSKIWVRKFKSAIRLESLSEAI